MVSKLRILVLAGGFPKEYDKKDGNYVFEQVSEMKKLGHDILVVSPTMYFPSFLKKYDKISRFITSKQYIYDGIDVIAPKMFVYYPTSRYWTKYPRIFVGIYSLTVMRTIQHILKEHPYDIVYSMGSVLEAGIVIKLKQVMPEQRFVYIEHSASISESLKEYKRYRLFYNCLVDAVDAMIFVSSKQKESIEAFVDLDHKYKILHNGFRGLAQSDSRIVQKKIFTIISVGFLEERKGYRYSIEALSMLAKEGYSFKYVVIGDGKEKDKYVNMVMEYGIEKNVEFKGRLQHDQVLEEMQSSDLFLLPSWNEAFGIVYLEAMSCGIPVVGTLCEGIEDIIVNNKNGFLVRKQDSYSIYRIIKLLIDNPTERINIGIQGKITATNYTWKKNAKKLVGIFNGISKE